MDQFLKLNIFINVQKMKTLSNMDIYITNRFRIALIIRLEERERIIIKIYL